MWTLSHCRVLLAFVIGLLTYLSVRLALEHHYVSDPQPTTGALADQLADRIDPNTATRGMIAALPGVGEKLAQAIVDYREAFAKENPGQAVFLRADDLRHVRGIGPAKAESMEPYLIFPLSPTAKSSH